MRRQKKIAESQNYVVVDSTIYSPEQIEVKKLLDKYITSSQKILESKNHTNYNDIFEAISYYQKTLESYNPDTIPDIQASYPYWDGRIQQQESIKYIVGYSHENKPEKFLESSVEKYENLLKDHLSVITQLANYGIAVFEFASCSENAEQGLRDFLDHLQLKKDLNKKKEKLNKEFKKWALMLGDKATAVPYKIFDEEVKEIRGIEKKIYDQVKQAEQNVSDLSIPMFCVFEPEKYQPKPVDFLYKAISPLREFSKPIPALKNHLSYLSISSLSNGMDEKLLKLMKSTEIMSNLNKPEKESGLFYNYLKKTRI